jgi:hypothetical protein
MKEIISFLKKLAENDDLRKRDDLRELELLIEKRGGGAREGIVGKVPVAGSRYRTHIQ